MWVREEGHRTTTPTLPMALTSLTEEAPFKATKGINGGRCGDFALGDLPLPPPSLQVVSWLHDLFREEQMTQLEPRRHNGDGVRFQPGGGGGCCCGHLAATERSCLRIH